MFKLTVIVHGSLQRVPPVGENIVASWFSGPGTSTLWISDTVTKDMEGTAALDCSGTVAGTLLLFTFVKKHRLS